MEKFSYFIDFSKHFLFMMLKMEMHKGCKKKKDKPKKLSCLAIHN